MHVHFHQKNCAAFRDVLWSLEAFDRFQGDYAVAMEKPKHLQQMMFSAAAKVHF